MQIKLGDLFQLGEHRLLCGDAKDTSAIKKLIGDDRIALILTDPPYGVAYVEGKAELTKIKKSSKIIANDQTQSEENYRQFTKEWLDIAKPYLARKNSFYIFNSDKMVFSLRDGIIDAEYRLTQLLTKREFPACQGGGESNLRCLPLNSAAYLSSVCV